MITAPPTVQAMAPALVSANKLEVGDKITAVNGTPVNSLGDLLSKGATAKPAVFTFAKPSGQTIEVPAADVTDEKGAFEFSLFRPNDAMVTSAPFISTPEPAAMTVTQFGSAMVSMERWKNTPNLLEVQVSFLAGANCTKCTLKSFGIVDTAHNSLLTPVAINQVAWLLYPDAGQPGQFVNVPPPTPIGATTNSTMTGSFSGTYQSFGNTGMYNGTVSGFGNSTTTYNYDYSAANAANMQNLGVAIRNASIQAQNAARAKFINERYGNLKLGALAPGETVTGHMFFAAPIGFDGPYAFVVSGEDRTNLVIFAANSDSPTAKKK